MSEMGRFPEGNSYPLQCSGLENSMDCIVRGSQRVRHDWATVTFTHRYGMKFFFLVLGCADSPRHRKNEHRECQCFNTLITHPSHALKSIRSLWTSLGERKSPARLWMEEGRRSLPPSGKGKSTPTLLQPPRPREEAHKGSSKHLVNQGEKPCFPGQEMNPCGCYKRQYDQNAFNLLFPNRSASIPRTQQYLEKVIADNKSHHYWNDSVRKLNFSFPSSFIEM